MLLNRIRSSEDDNNNLVYHYCSTQTFLSIIQNKTIRFSDANMLNDAEEGIWGYKIFIEAVNRFLKKEGIPEGFPAIPKDFFDEIDKIWSSFQLRLMNFIACFSTDGDSLSQWRAYADDGRGFAIGFKLKELHRLPVKVLDVLYDRDTQINEMTAILASIYTVHIKSKSDYSSDDLFTECALLAATSIALKNPAWRDEKEVRIQHIVDVNIEESRWTLSDKGGIGDGKEVAGQSIGFQARNSAIVPFFDMPFELSNEHQPIQEIVLGPRCSNGPGNIMFALGNSGYQNIRLRVAGSAYR